jgi:hypothetical protein
MAAIRECVGMVLLVTPAANQSPDVLQEVQIAHSQKKTILPVIVGSIAPSDDLGYFLAVRQHISWTTTETVCAAVVQSLGLTAYQADKDNSTATILNAHAAIAGAAAAKEGITGSFIMVVKSSGSDSGVAYLSSELDYRDQQCLSVAIKPEARTRFAKSYGKDPTDHLKGKTIIVTGTARKKKVYFVVNRIRTDHYYYQTHVDVSDIDQITIQTSDRG